MKPLSRACKKAIKRKNVIKKMTALPGQSKISNIFHTDQKTTTEDSLSETFADVDPQSQTKCLTDQIECMFLIKRQTFLV